MLEVVANTEKQVLSRLRTARRLFDTPDAEIDLTMPGPRQASMYELELAEPKLSTAPLPLPPPHVFDSAPMRPVSSAIHDGVSMLFGGVGIRPFSFGGVDPTKEREGLPTMRSSVFKLW